MQKLILYALYALYAKYANVVSLDRERYFNFKAYVVHTHKKNFLYANLGLDGFTKPQ